MLTVGGVRRPRGAGSRGRRGGKGGEWGEVGRGSELERRAPLAVGRQGARAPALRPASASSPRAPLLASGCGGDVLTRPGRGRKGAREGLRLQERAGRPAAGNVCSTYFFLLLLGARSCRFQEEELRATSLGSGAAKSVRLSATPPPSTPPVPPTCVGPCGLWSVYRELGSGRCPGPRAAGRLPGPRSYWPPPASLL